MNEPEKEGEAPKTQDLSDEMQRLQTRGDAAKKKLATVTKYLAAATKEALEHDKRG